VSFLAVKVFIRTLSGVTGRAGCAGHRRRNVASRFHVRGTQEAELYRRAAVTASRRPRQYPGAGPPWRAGGCAAGMTTTTWLPDERLYAPPSRAHNAEMTTRTLSPLDRL